jgi:hypothetical protein
MRAMRIKSEELLGSLVAAGGIIWGVRVAIQDMSTLWNLSIRQPGPLEVCSVGILLWLHAKWRRSVKV